MATNQKVACSSHAGRTKNSILINKLGVSNGNEADAFFAGMPKSMPTLNLWPVVILAARMRVPYENQICPKTEKAERQPVSSATNAESALRLRWVRDYAAARATNAKSTVSGLS
jgi:hypothetical protein